MGNGSPGTVGPDGGNPGYVLNVDSQDSSCTYFSSLNAYLGYFDLTHPGANPNTAFNPNAVDGGVFSHPSNGFNHGGDSVANATLAVNTVAVNTVTTENYRQWNWEQALFTVLGVPMPDRAEIANGRWTGMETDSSGDSRFYIYGVTWGPSHQDALTYLSPAFTTPGAPWPTYEYTPLATLSNLAPGPDSLNLALYEPTVPLNGLDPSSFALPVVALQSAEGLYLNAVLVLNAVTADLAGENSQFQGQAGGAFAQLMQDMQQQVDYVATTMGAGTLNSYSETVFLSGVQADMFLSALANTYSNWTQLLPFSPLGAILATMISKGLVVGQPGAWNVNPDVNPFNTYYGDMSQDPAWVALELDAKALWLNTLNALDYNAQQAVGFLINAYGGAISYLQPSDTVPPSITPIDLGNSSINGGGGGGTLNINLNFGNFGSGPPPNPNYNPNNQFTFPPLNFNFGGLNFNPGPGPGNPNQPGGSDAALLAALNNLGGGLADLGGGLNFLGGGLNNLGGGLGSLGGGLNNLGGGLGGLGGLGGGLNNLGSLGSGPGGPGASASLGSGLGGGLNALGSLGSGLNGSSPAASDLQSALNDNTALQNALQSALASGQVPPKSSLGGSLQTALNDSNKTQAALDQAAAAGSNGNSALQTALTDNASTQEALKQALASGQVPPNSPLHSTLQSALNDSNKTQSAINQALAASAAPTSAQASAVRSALGDNSQVQHALTQSLVSGQVPTNSPLHSTIESALTDTGRTQAALNQALANGTTSGTAALNHALTDNQAVQKQLHAALASGQVPASGPLRNDLNQALNQSNNLSSALHQALAKQGVVAEPNFGALSSPVGVPHIGSGLSSLGGGGGVGGGGGLGSTPLLSSTIHGGGAAGAAAAVSPIPASSGRFVSPTQQAATTAQVQGTQAPAQTTAAGGQPFPMYSPMAGGGGGMMGGQNGSQSQERERSTWLAEDEDVWGTGPAVGPHVIGREDSTADEVPEDYDDFTERPKPPGRPNYGRQGGR